MDPKASAHPSSFPDFLPKFWGPTSRLSPGSPFHPPASPQPLLWDHQRSGYEMGAVGGRGEPEAGPCVTWVLVCPPKSCPEAIEEVFQNKFHIIGAVGIGIAVVMVSAGGIGRES